MLMFSLQRKQNSHSSTHKGLSLTSFLIWPSSWSRWLLSLFKLLLEAEDTQVELSIDYRAKRMKEEEQKPIGFLPLW